MIPIYMYNHFYTVHCPPLISLNNGVITYNPPDSPEGENTVATYSCNVDYMLIGESTRTCQSDRTWSSIAPYCAGEYICHKCYKSHANSYHLSHIHIHADSAMIQLKFAPTEHCIQWNVSEFYKTCNPGKSIKHTHTDL